MFGFGIGTWIKLGLVIAAVIAIFVLKHTYDEGKRDEGRSEVQVQWDADRAERIKRTSELVVTLSNRLMEEMDAKRKADLDVAAVFAVVENNLGRVRSTRAGIVLPADVERVLVESADAANTRRAGTDDGGKTRADPVPATPEAAAGVYDEREFAGYLVQSAKAYDDAYGLWKFCRVREDACRDALRKGANP